MKCIYLGEHEGDLIRVCCGGKEEREPIYRCACPKQSADHCSLTPTVKGLVVVEISGNRTVEAVASLARCPFREQAANLSPVPITGDVIPKTKARRMWEELRERRNPPPNVGRVVVVNCDSHGYGDAVVTAWIAEGTKDATPRIACHATGRKKEFLELFGQTVLPAMPLMTSPAAGFDVERRGSSAPRWVNWYRSLGIQHTALARPAVSIPDRDNEWAEGLLKGTVIGIAPQTTHTPREWPPIYWKELYAAIREMGLPVAWLGLPDSRYSELDELKTLGDSWSRAAAAINRCSVVIGNDSAMAHVAGTIGVPTIAILGPTTEAAFSHMPSVHCLATPKRVVECSGCAYGFGYDNLICKRGCAALSNVIPKQVMEKIKELCP